jgi:fibronectin-binding autotransporter adhesin
MKPEFENPSKFFRSKLALIATALLSTAVSSSAGNTWTGGGSTTNWSDNGNWGGSATSYGTLTFTTGGTQGTTSVNNSITAQNRLLWNGSNTWTLNNSGGTVLSLFDNGGTQAKIENLSSGLVTINAPITFAANNGAPPNPFGEINAVNGDITFGTGSLIVNGTSVNGIKFFGSGFTTTFNNTVSATGKWMAMTSMNGSTLSIGGSYTCGDFYVMNGGTLALQSGGSLTSPALRLGGDFGTTGNQNQSKNGIFQLTATNGGQVFNGTINTVGGNTSNALLIDSKNTSGTNSLGGSIFLDSNLTIQNSANGLLQLSGNTIDIKSQQLTINNSGALSITKGITSSTNGGSVIKTSAGILTLNGVGNHTGGTRVSAGTLVLGVTNALPTTSGSLAVGGPDATVEMNGNDQTVAGFNDNGGLTSGTLKNSSIGTSTFTLNNTGLDDFAGVISDGGTGKLLKLVKNGTGILTLSGSNTYSGDTIINSGTLALGTGGSLGNTAMTINSGASFSPIQGSSVGLSTGSAGAGIILKNGGTLDMTSGGTGTVGTFILNPGSNTFPGVALDLQGGTLKFDLGNGTTDQLIVNSGASSVSGVNYVSVKTAGLSSLTPGTYTLISSPNGGLAGSFLFNSGSPLNVISPVITVTAGANTYRLSLNSSANELQIVITNAPARSSINIMPLGASITEGASADNPYNGGGYRSKLYQYLANDGRFNINFLGSNTRLFDYNATSTNILTTANQLRNEGHFGSTTWQIQNNLNGYDNSNSNGSNNGGFWLAPGNGVNPNYVALNVGGNDYVSNPNDPFVVDRLNQIITTVSALRPGVTVLVSNLAWRTGVGPSINSRYNPFVPGMVYNLVLNGYHVRFVDMYGVMSPNDSNANLSSDQIHPSQTGYNLMADTWWKSLAYGAAYWTGNQDGFWNTITPTASTNWAMDHPRSTDRQALLDSGTDVHFNSNASPITTTLGANVSIRSLNFASGASAPVTISGNNTLNLGSSGMTVQSGTGSHTISANIALGSSQTWSNISSNPLTLNGSLAGSGVLKLVGPAFFNFGGANSNTGDIAVDSGGLWIGDNGSLSGQGFIYVGNGAPSNASVNASILSASTNSPVPNAIVTNKADTGSTIGSGTRTIGGTNTSGTVTYSGAVFINGGTVLTSTAGGITAFNNTVANGSDTGNISRAITIAGNGTVLLAGVNTYTGGTSINSGSLQIGNTGTLPPTGFVYVGNGGTPYANVDASLLSGNTATPIGNAIVTNKADTGTSTGTGSRIIGGVNTSGTVTYNGSVFLNGSTTLTAAAGGTVAFTNAITNGSDTGNVSRSITITGLGIVRLAGNSTYSGNTTVSGSGTLQLDGSIAGSVTVSSGSSITGNGTVNQNLTINNGGTMRINGVAFTVNGNIVNNGLCILCNGARLSGNSTSFINNGTFDTITAGTTTLPAGFQNNGVVIDASVVKVANISKSGNIVSISINSHTGHLYQLQYSPTLAVGSFTDIGLPQSGSTGSTLLFMATDATGSKGFYRVKVNP